MSDPVMIGIASIPEREGSLKESLASLAPQADRIAVSLNDYREVPRFFARYSNVEAVLKPDGNKGDGEKFAAVDEWPGYVLTCDDDILYPPDYVAKTIEGIERYDRNRIVSYHGGRILGWGGSPVSTSTGRVRCLSPLEDDRDHINLGGTGVSGYHAQRIPVYADVFRHANMADVQLACHARIMGAPYVALAHPGRWVKDICPPEGRRIYWSNRDRDGTACDTHDLREEEINRFDWTSDPPARPRVRVSIATCDRPELLGELFDDLYRESRWVDLEVAVYEDPTGADYGLCRRRARRHGWTWMMFDQRLGRTGYWQYVTRWMRDAKRSSADWFISLNDDVRLVPYAIPRAISTWYRLKDPGTLELWRVQSFDQRASWTSKPPVHGGEAIECFNVDGNFLCRRRALEELGFRIRQPLNPAPTGSGVGRELSRRLDRAGVRMYRVNKSLALNNDGGVSIMNPAERQRHPIVTL